MIIYGLKNCDSCRKAMKAFPNATLRDVRKDGVPSEVLERAFAVFGERLLNTRSTTWRELDDAARNNAPLDLIAQHPTLMKRPLIDVENQLYLGWNNNSEAEISALS